MWTAIKKIIPFSIGKLGLGHLLETSELCSKWEGIQEKLFGAEYKNKTRPVSLKNKVLIVDCLSSVWASELQMKQQVLVGEINKIFKKEIVEKIRFIS